MFQIRPGAYNDETLIEFLDDLHRHLDGAKVTLIWDGLPSHRSRRMQAWIAAQRRWLVVERLPGYAPDLNPVEGLWGTSKAPNSPTCAPTPSTPPPTRPRPASNASAPTATWASPSSATAAFLYDESVTVLCEPL